MCLTIKSGPHTAKRDFYVLKIADNIGKTKCTSPYRAFPYEYGKSYSNRITVFGGVINRGIHSLIVEGCSDGRWVDVACYFNVTCRSPSGFLLCKIPKGSTYYLGDDSDVVSNRLEVLFPVITGEENASSISDGIQIECDSFRKLAKLAENWVKEAGYNIQPS